MTSYRDSIAYQRSNRLRADGTPVFPLGFRDRSSAAQERADARVLARRVAGSGMVG